MPRFVVRRAEQVLDVTAERGRVRRALAIGAEANDRGERFLERQCQGAAAIHALGGSARRFSSWASVHAVTVVLRSVRPG